MLLSKAALLALLVFLPAAPARAVDPVAEAEVARRAGDAARAIALLEPLAAGRPHDSDILRRLGVSYASAARYPQAIATLERARVLAPADQDIALALARTRLWAGDKTGARREAEAIRCADPANAELPELLEALDRGRQAPSARNGVSLTAALSGSTVELDAGGTQDWREAVAAASVRLGNGTTLSGEVEHVDREFAVDTRLSASINTRLGDTANFWLGATSTPNASFREQWSTRGGVEIKATRHSNLLLDARYASYRSTSVTLIEPGVRLTWDGQLWATELRSINSFQEGRHRLGWSGRVERLMPGDRKLFAGAATYPDTENGITRRVRGGYVGFALPLAGALTLRLTADRERRAAAYDRYGLTAGLTWRPQR